MFQPTILVTGFLPFLDQPANASEEAVKLLADEIGGCRIVKRILPVKWFDCVYELDKAIGEVHPQGILSTGQGYPKPPLLIERMGHNVAWGPCSDWERDMHDQPIFPNGPAAYFSTFPYKEMHDRLKQEKIPVRYSFSAGQNQCNCVCYAGLHLAATRYPDILSGFIHVPMIADGKTEGMFTSEETAHALSLCLEEYAKVLCKPVRTIDQYREDM